MATLPSALSKPQLAKFIEGFNQLITNGPQINRYGYKKDGADFARRIVLHWQITNVIDAHGKLGTIDTGSNFKELEALYKIADDYFEADWKRACGY